MVKVWGNAEKRPGTKAMVKTHALAQLTPPEGGRDADRSWLNRLCEYHGRAQGNVMDLNRGKSSEPLSPPRSALVHRITRASRIQRVPGTLVNH